jgi:hypothetical protein
MLASLISLTPFLLAQPGPVDYVKEIKPLLAEKCYACHGALQQKADLRLDTARSMFEGGTSGPVVVAGKGDKSVILDHLLARKGARRMPPPSDGEALKAEQIAKIRRWIDEGAKAPADEKPEADPRDHWAFRAPNAVHPPGTGHVIDAWLAAERDKRGLKPQPPADRRLLLRRVYLDLIGLPPTLAEQETFLADTSKHAYEKVVDRLLASPQHGERWARHWMDIWRYSDPWGLGAEIRSSQKHIWHWRDWIIESLNADVGYDEMLREMLAADELYPNDLAKLRASGFLVRPYFKFNRNTWLDEVVEHTSKAFLGLTLNCTKCHDHKFDPFTQTDYYRFRAFFEPYQVRMDMLPGETDLEKDGLPRAFDCNLEAPTYVFVRGDDRQPKKERPIAPNLPKLLMWGPLDVQPVKLPVEAYEPQLRRYVADNYLRSAKVQIEQAKVALEKAQKDLQAAPSSGGKNRDLLEATVRAAEKSLAVAEGTSAALKARADNDRLMGDVWDLLGHRPDSFFDFFRSSRSDPSPKEIERDLERMNKLREAAKEIFPLAVRLERELVALQAEETVTRLEVDVLRAEPAKRADAEKKLTAAKVTVTQARKATEDPKARPTPLRGALKTLESNVETEASRNKPFPTTSTGRRSALAAWLTDRKNPLTARVAVNHIWARHFGTPLVATVFDFGRKGAAPTHPELLDSLAVEFMEHGWSMKRIHRLIVTSAAYRMSSSSADADPKTLAADPENRFYWRRNAPRMEAQLIRDSLLQLADQLDPKVGGPPVPIAQELSPRRSLYFVHSNNDNQKFLSQFDDASVRECYRRSESIVPQQALALANSKLTLTMTAKITERLQKKLASAPDADFVRTAFQLLLGCDPTAEEMTECTAALAEWRTLAAKRPDAAVRARNNLVHALINHNDFVTIR